MTRLILMCMVYGYVMPYYVNFTHFMYLYATHTLGTLTLNKMQLEKDCPIYKQGETQYSLLRLVHINTQISAPYTIHHISYIINLTDTPPWHQNGENHRKMH
ncbi:hypothetical protein EON63_04615 [archaeon]|nr:MAG: hypothetical protein EON63_04615 [archaeon]